MLSTICSAKQKSLQMCAELRHCQRWVTNGERQLQVPQWWTRDGKTSLSLSRRSWLRYRQIAACCRLEMTSAIAEAETGSLICICMYVVCVLVMKVTASVSVSRRCRVLMSRDQDSFNTTSAVYSQLSITFRTVLSAYEDHRSLGRSIKRLFCSWSSSWMPLSFSWCWRPQFRSWSSEAEHIVLILSLIVLKQKLN